MGLGKPTPNLWEGFPIPDARNNIPDSGEEAQLSALTGLWKKLMPALMVDLERFKTSVEQVTADVAEMARKLALEMEPNADTEFLGPRDGTLTDAGLLLMDEQGEWRWNPRLVGIEWQQTFVI